MLIRRSMLVWRSVMLLACLVAAGCGVPLPTPVAGTSDAELTQQLAGTWRESVGGDTFIHEFGTDGSYKGVEEVEQDGASPTSFAGTWAISDGTLIYTIQTSSPPSYEPGSQIKDQVISLTESEFRYKSEDGGEGTMTRSSP